jgi:hypothetical protein
MNQVVQIKKIPMHGSQGSRHRNANRPDRVTVMRDAQLIANALKYADADRRDFILRLRRSFHQFGSLTTAMREALTRRK